MKNYERKAYLCTVTIPPVIIVTVIGGEGCAVMVTGTLETHICQGITCKQDSLSLSLSFSRTHHILHLRILQHFREF